MVVLAVGLALLGMVFALQQIRVLEHILRRQTQNRALQIANDASNTFNRQVEKALQAAANSCQAGNGGSWERPGDWPVWIDGLYQWNGRKLKTLDRQAGGLPRLEDVVAGRLRDRPVDDAGANGLASSFSTTMSVVVRSLWPVDVSTIRRPAPISWR